MGFSSSGARAAMVAGLAAIYIATLLVTDGLSFDTRLDEIHFWRTTESHFVGSFPPSAETLRSYPEIITPLSYIIWGQLHRLTSDGIFAGRVLNFLMSVAMIALLARSRLPYALTGPLAAVGLLAYPYFIALSTHLYTDTIATFFVLYALHAHCRGWMLASVLLFALAISTRQYVIQIPAAVAIWEGWRLLQGESRKWQLAAAVVSSATLFGWILFWGGLAPTVGIGVWTHQYPSPMFHVLQFMLEYGNYFLVVIGIYFVLPEMLLFRRWPRSALFRSRRMLLCVVGVGCLFLMDPPFLSAGFPGGVFGRTMRWLLPGALGEAVRISVFYLLALMTVLRFSHRIDLGLLIVLLAFVMAMKSQIGWEKYALPALTALWYLRSRPGLLLPDAWAPESGKVWKTG